MVLAALDRHAAKGRLAMTGDHGIGTDNCRAEGGG
jgi:hypothetical protein